MNYPPDFINYCALGKIKLTSLRKSVLFILWGAKRPLKAYEILNNLLQIKRNAKPTSLYRVLHYFIEGGIVHKLDSIQAYILCQEPTLLSSAEMLMICNLCHKVMEVYEKKILDLIQILSTAKNFHPEQNVLQLKGKCHRCATNE